MEHYQRSDFSSSYFFNVFLGPKEGLGIETCPLLQRFFQQASEAYVYGGSQKKFFLLILPVLSSLSITSAHTYSLMVWQDCLSMYTACVRYVVK